MYYCVQAPPLNEGSVTFRVLDIKIDWMSRPIMIARFLEPVLCFRDEWVSVKSATDPQVTNRAEVHANLSLKWKDLEMAITKTTTADLIKIYNKLYLFFQEQIKASRQAFMSYAEQVKFTELYGKSVLAYPKAEF